MRKPWTILVASLLVAAGPVHARTTVAPTQAADRLLEALHQANGVPGMGAAVVRGERLLWSGSVGLSDVEAGRRTDGDTVFRLASVSKVVTATAAARLIEQGRLDADAPVAPMLPWLQAAWAPITSRQLAAHVSGLPHYSEADRALGGLRYPRTRDAVAIFADRRLASTPGSSYQYSSWGYTLLSAVVEARSGRPFLDYLAEEITPGLEIGPDRYGSVRPTVAGIYGFEDGAVRRLPVQDMSYTWGGGGLAATPAAIAHFGGRLLSGRIVSPRTFAWMLEPVRMHDGSPAGERGFDVGFGWRTGVDERGRRIAHHAGVFTGARSALVLWPDTGISASLLSNASWVSSIEQTTMLLASALEPQPAARQRPCPTATTTFEATFGGETVAGPASFAVRDGLCEGRIALPSGVLRTWLNRFPQRDAEALRVIGFDGAGGLASAAIVTPIGLHGLVASQTPARFDAELATGRRLTLALR